MFVHTYILTLVHVYMYVYIFVCFHIHMDGSMCVCMHIYMCVGMSVLVHCTFIHNIKQCYFPRTGLNMDRPLFSGYLDFSSHRLFSPVS